MQKRAEWSIERGNELFHPLITKSLSVSIAYEWHKSRYCFRGKTISTFACVYSFTNDRGT